MAKYKIIMDDDEQDEIFDTYEEAEDYALYLISCYHTGSEILEMSNPGRIFRRFWTIILFSAGQ